MALDGDEVHDDNDGDMLCIPTTLWVNADYRHCDVLHRKDVHEKKTQPRESSYAHFNRDETPKVELVSFPGLLSRARQA